MTLQGLKKGEELHGRKRISRIIKTENPPVDCFIKVAYGNTSIEISLLLARTNQQVQDLRHAFSLARGSKKTR